MMTTTLSTEQVQRIKRMKRDELIANAQSEDMAVFVEASLRLHRTTFWLNVVLIVLTAALVGLTWALVHFACR
jgi:hypothetical protein